VLLLLGVTIGCQPLLEGLSAVSHIFVFSSLGLSLIKWLAGAHIFLPCCAAQADVDGWAGELPTEAEALRALRHMQPLLQDMHMRAVPDVSMICICLVHWGVVGLLEPARTSCSTVLCLHLS
jgi:hypothetical protein